MNISFRSLNLETDLDLLHNWVNRAYSKKFWQLNGSKSLLYKTYHDILNNPYAHSFIGCFDNQPACQIDLYNIVTDELKDHIEYNPNDCGLHLLMLPPEQMIKGLSIVILRHFIHFYFSFPSAQNLYAEPDEKNILAGRLAEKGGFVFQKKIIMSYKTANLYRITKQQFYATNPIS